MTTPEKLSMLKQNIVDQNVEKIAGLFPNCITQIVDNGESKKVVDFDKLRQELSDFIVDGSTERYSFNWPEKKKATLLANAPCNKTLRPVRKMSVNFDTTKNIYIEGDNLEVLKCLRETYFGKVKMIYIDPPYNTGKDFIYSDKFSESIDSYLARSDSVDEEGNKLVMNPETNGRFHTNWLNMMYPRLKVARDLLADDGVILINIDEHEVVNLHKLIEEIYGEDNLLGTIVWDKRNPKGDSKGIASQHEYILVCAKNRNFLLSYHVIQRKKRNAETILKKAKDLYSSYPKKRTLEEVNDLFKEWMKKQKNLSGGEVAYDGIDESGRVYRLVSMAWPNKDNAPADYHIPLIHPVTGNACPVPQKGWRNPPEKMKELLLKDLIVFGKDDTTQPQRKYFLDENMMENIPSLLYYGGSDEALLKKLGINFDNPKVVEVCREHIASFTEKDSIILDFFSGSGTVAHAVLKQNALDGGNRKFIMVQWPEECDLKNQKAGFRTICDIGRERIKRAGALLTSNTQKTSVDVGFRTFKLDTGNFFQVERTPNEIVQKELLSLMTNVKPDRSGEDLLVQVMLSIGVTLDCSIEQTIVAGKEVYKVADNYLIACFDKDVTDQVVEAIAKERPVYAVLRDDCFSSDSVADNFEQIFKTYAPETICKVI